MIDYYLKFDSEAEATALLYTDEKPNYQNIDTLGTLYELPPADAPEDYVPVEIPGWHVNVRTIGDEDGSPLEPYRVDPEPQVWRRVWG